jgi:hypothetical protein
MQLDNLKNQVASSGYAIFSSPELKKLGLLAREEYLNNFTKLPIHPPREKFHYSILDSAPYRKFAISSANGVGEPYAQFLQTTYYSEEDKNYPNLMNVFNELIKIRNQMLDQKNDFGSIPNRDGYWNACRVHHYPKGGGFMVEHKDTHFPKVLEESSLPFLQVMMALSIKGKDFLEGGNYIRTREGKQIFPEDIADIGSLIMFDGGITHGVQDVDPDSVLNLESSSGRFAAFVNLYEVPIRS